MTTSFIIFSGYNERSIICLCRTLHEFEVPFCIISLSAEDPIYKTHYANRVVATRRYTTLQLEDIDVCLKKAKRNVPTDNHVIAPSSEFLNLFLLNNRTHFESLGVELPLPDMPIYKQLSDKKKFSELCFSRGIPIPEELNSTDLRTNMPFVAKPKSDITPEGLRVIPEIIETEKDWFRLSSCDSDLYFYQRYIRGPSYYFLFYCHADGRVDAFSQKNLLQQPNGKSIVLAEVSDIHMTQYVVPYKKLLRNLAFRGLIMIEVKLENSKLYMIEANPRMWGPAQLMADAGNNLFISFINDYAKTNFKMPSKHRNKNYLWSGGIANALETSNSLDAYANKDRIIEILQADETVDIYKRADTEAAFRCDPIKLDKNKIREVI